ncbi:helix-turn-helix domain-containing protein [Gordonia polyisoprenivorans]|uniref:helix-turn-helix domain-containing protein n=1 Tax=Gordonia polyisoprenivorans TaxID=84595 RepID=UPI0003823D97|nr:helix-turn-helix transcriptional regulator [Gordonia polyisoprenivorans]
MSKDVESDQTADKPARDDLRFARNMVAYREARGMTQKDLVAALQSQGWTSVYQNTISRIEKGDRPVRYGEALAIARVFGVSVEKFTLTPTESRLAIELAMMRQRYFDVRVELARLDDVQQARRRDRDALRVALREAIQKARSAGIEPTELPDEDSGMLLVPTTVEDELALAIAELGDES